MIAFPRSYFATSASSAFLRASSRSISWARSLCSQNPGSVRADSISAIRFSTSCISHEYIKSIQRERPDRASRNPAFGDKVRWDYMASCSQTQCVEVGRSARTPLHSSDTQGTRSTRLKHVVQHTAMWVPSVARPPQAF